MVDELVEPAGLAVLGQILMQEGQLLRFEDLEEPVPADLFQADLGRIEVDAQQIAAALGLPDPRRPAAA